MGQFTSNVVKEGHNSIIYFISEIYTIFTNWLLVHINGKLEKYAMLSIKKYKL